MPPAEKIAREMLTRREPSQRFDLVEDAAVRRALSSSTPGSVLQERMDRRRVVLEEETERVGAVLTYLVTEVGLALEMLEATP